MKDPEEASDTLCKARDSKWRDVRPSEYRCLDFANRVQEFRKFFDEKEARDLGAPEQKKPTNEPASIKLHRTSRIRMLGPEA